jgi:hypothetical protein
MMSIPNFIKMLQLVQEWGESHGNKLVLRGKKQKFTEGL